jgi:ABC-type antimicrobial peptide transport system permease subunit
MALNSRVPVLRASTMTDYIGRSLALQRVVGTVIGWSAALAVVLACLGVYSVVAFTVSRRRTEMGLRMALGATRQQVTKLVLGEMSRLVAVGVVAGIAAAALASRILSGLLIGVSPLDPAAFAVATVVVASSALLTTWIPARRAASANPALELRAE